MSGQGGLKTLEIIPSPSRGRGGPLGSDGSGGAAIDMTERLRHYHRILRDLSLRGASEEVWQRNLREILTSFDDECAKLPQKERERLRRELAAEIEHEVMYFASPAGSAVLTVALKHLGFA